jgi:hypothetical protein
MSKAVLTVEELAAVTGGMRLDDLPESPHVEDRRGWSRRRSMNARSAIYPEPKPGPRFEGDLPSQLGLDDLIAMGHRSRRRRR